MLFSALGIYNGEKFFPGYTISIVESDPYDHLRSIHNCNQFYDHTKSWITHCSIQRSPEETLNQFKSDEVTYYSTILACSDLGKAVACRRDINLSSLGELQYENDLYADSIYQRLMDGLRNSECEYGHTA